LTVGGGLGIFIGVSFMTMFEIAELGLELIFLYSSMKKIRKVFPNDASEKPKDTKPDLEHTQV
jgi:hypothetical protein